MNSFSHSLNHRQLAVIMIGPSLGYKAWTRNNYGGLWKILLLFLKVNLKGQDWVTVEVGFLKVGFSQPA